MRIDELCEALGSESAADDVVAVLGGGSVYVPLTPQGSALAAKIGERAAERLSAEYGGEAIWIPIDERTRPSVRVRSLLLSGVEPRQARRQVRCSFMTVRTVIKDLERLGLWPLDEARS